MIPAGPLSFWGVLLFIKHNDKPPGKEEDPRNNIEYYFGKYSFLKKYYFGKHFFPPMISLSSFV